MACHPAAHLLTVMSDEITRAFHKSRATRGVALHISKAFGRVSQAFLLHKLKSTVFHVRFWALFRHFSVIDGFGRSWMGSRCWSTPLMLVFRKTPHFVLCFSYYTLMVFLIMLSAILLSKLTVLLTTLGVIGLLICGNRQR